MIRLSVNLNKVALIRNARGGGVPDLALAARACLDAGAGGITLHPRPDRRHALAEDAHELAPLLRERGAELNLEGNPLAPPEPGYPGLLQLCDQVRPQQATLVPDAREQKTSDHGWDFSRPSAQLRELEKLAGQFRDLGCRLSLFIDPDPKAAEGAARIGADSVELYTEAWARAAADPARAPAVLDSYRAAAQRASELGLGVHAGHDLSLDNLAPICGLPGLAEVSIGQALVADALQTGLAQAVAAYLEILRAA